MKTRTMTLELFVVGGFVCALDAMAVLKRAIKKKAKESKKKKRKDSHTDRCFFGFTVVLLFLLWLECFHYAPIYHHRYLLMLVLIIFHVYLNDVAGSIAMLERCTIVYIVDV